MIVDEVHLTETSPTDNGEGEPRNRQRVLSLLDALGPRDALLAILIHLCSLSLAKPPRKGGVEANSCGVCHILAL